MDWFSLVFLNPRKSTKQNIFNFLTFNLYNMLYSKFSFTFKIRRNLLVTEVTQPSCGTESDLPIAHVWAVMITKVRSNRFCDLCYLLYETNDLSSCSSDNLSYGNNMKHWPMPASGQSTTHEKTTHRVQFPTGSATNGPCLLYTSPSPRDRQKSRMPSSA